MSRRHLPTAPRLVRLAGRVLVVWALLAGGAVSAQTVRFESEPAGARVEVDGLYVGTTPVVRTLTPGSRTVRLRRGGFAPWQQEVVVAAGDTTRVRATLDRLYGTLEIDGLPDDATVTADGAPIEATAPLGAGFTTVVVRVPG